MLGGDHRKERFGERFFGVRSQPANRGCLPGTEPRSQGYGARTLIGNWSEERADMTYYDDKPALSLDSRWGWHSTYAATIGSAAAAASPGTTRDLNPLCLLQMENKTGRAYPCHEPKMDPQYADTAAERFVTTTMRNFRAPGGEAAMPQKQAVMRVMRLPGDSAEAVQTDAVLRRLRAQLQAQLPGRSMLPGCVARTMRRALCARARPRSAAQLCSNDAEVNVWELCEGLQSLGLHVCPAECTVLIRYHGTYNTTSQEAASEPSRRGPVGHDESASVNRLTCALRGEMNTRRVDVCDRLYRQLESVCAQRVVRMARLVELFDAAAAVREVRDGAITAREALRMFAEQWDVLDPNAYISCEHFREFYADVSFEIANYDAFERFMTRSYRIGGQHSH